MTRYKKRIQTRLIAAAALVVASFISAFVLSTMANQKVPMWSTTRVLVPGHMIVSEDLVLRNVVLGDIRALYLQAPEDPSGSIVMRPIPRDELVPKSALSLNENEAQTSAVPISIHASDLPTDMLPGEIVNLYHVGDSTLTQDIGPPTLILSQIFLLSIDKKGQSLGGEISLTISVDAQDILKLLNATSTGRIVVVRING